ncbi:MAG: hypothetical protein BGO70_05625 [Bacteroidetes bacterium 43-93]|nr:T9SS type A sorting domain-containing protein [Bacteroidota bacterium]OJW96878.1 MAG: hypothetical protein BGO70_05625 [Bacteroidetes bacterium 43-93]
MKKLFPLCIALAAAMPASAQKFTKNCIPTYTNSCSDGFYIKSVVTTGGIQNISSTSACGNTSNNYSYYSGTGKTLEVNAGSTVSIVINTSISSTAGAALNRMAVWVDWNRDDSFDNTNFLGPLNPEAELVGQGLSAPTTPCTITFVVPHFAKDGISRLRIRSLSSGTYTSTPNGSNAPGDPVNPCITNSPVVSGETEDYDVIVHNPCLKIPTVTFSNTTSKGTDVNWVNNGNERLLEYTVDQNPNDPGTGNYLLNPNTTSMHLPNSDIKHIKCNTTYYFHIRSICDTDSHSQATYTYGPWTTVSFTTPPCCDMPPVDINDITSTTALATWQPVTSVYAYEYAVGIAGEPAPTGGTRASATALTINGLDCGREYYFFIRALCSPTPTSDWSVDSFLTQPCLSVDNTPALPAFTINAYPNPVHSTLTLSVMHGIKRSDATIQLTDISGKLLKTATMTGDKIDLDLKEIPAGLYLLHYTDGERSQVIKISKE